MDNQGTEKWVGFDDIVYYLGVSKDTIRNWIRKYNMPAHKVGRLWKFKYSEIDAWIHSGKSTIEITAPKGDSHE